MHATTIPPLGNIRPRVPRVSRTLVAASASALVFAVIIAAPSRDAFAQSCTAPTTCTNTTATCNFGRWPGGFIFYKWASGTEEDSPNKEVRQAMTDWEVLSAHVIEFHQMPDLPDSSSAITRVKIDSNGGGLTPGFADCQASMNHLCTASLNLSNVYHELGHLIGFEHEFMRYDRNRYYRIPCGTGTPGQNAANSDICQSPDDLGSFGPYDFQSALGYWVTHPDHTRWNGSPIVPGAMCSERKAGPLPPQCSGGNPDGTECKVGGVCNPLRNHVLLPATLPAGYNLAYACPTCATCQKYQPFYYPTKSDGAAVVEMYRNLFDSHWSVFKRTMNPDPTATSPYDNSVAPFQFLKHYGSAAVDTWEGGALSIYAVGGTHVYQRTKTGTSWSGWTDLGGSISANSDPAAVSMASNRTDLVVRAADGDVWIKTKNAGSWSTWQSLGRPSVGAASSPAITSREANRLDVFVRGGDDQLWVKTCTSGCSGSLGAWSAWNVPVPNGTFRGKPAVVSRGDGLIDIFVQGMDGHLWGTWTHSNGNGWWYLVSNVDIGWDPGHPDATSPAVGSRGWGILDVYIRGTDEKLWVSTWENNAWGPFKALGGVLSSSPATVTRARTTNRADVIGMMWEETTSGVWNAAPWWKQYQ